ncbi:peptide/nickel transport system ATP-binding protein [Sinosporangium album]|uniref:Peptide/nickel transport system ATP-binding protein n=1 Tax=Sinosporangium album TaxID=504805 RepID=A0A1G7ZRX7_9ACTN|nr:ABC transporter ATP-binding protein [Sinosporangium album]SDH11435.1 peptide/nickel transport system ATP-binding protein [Sinosporangium album]
MSDLLSVEDLEVSIGAVRPVRGVSLRVAPGEIVGVVGETGCGKTLTGLAVLGLLPPGARASGRVVLGGDDVLGGDPRAVRGRKVTMVFQNPGTAFDPVTTIGGQFARVLRAHTGCSRRAARARAAELLTAVELPERVLDNYPHQLSGGMLQRCMIALALSCEPSLVIADEATTALDVTVARQILRLLLRLQREHGFGVMFVTHNLAEARDICDRVYVLYAGRVAEEGMAHAVLDRPRHPYTRALLAALPRLDAPRGRLASIPGSVSHAEVGCSFAERCPDAKDVCRAETPPAHDGVACHFPGGAP